MTRSTTEKYQACTSCDGSGAVLDLNITSGSRKCTTCNGTGRVLTERTVVETDPVQTGDALSVRVNGTRIRRVTKG